MDGERCVELVLVSGDGALVVGGGEGRDEGEERPGPLLPPPARPAVSILVSGSIAIRQEGNASPLCYLFVENQLFLVNHG